ncbi:MFS transporter [Celerinatantimonas sp. MCCC 1A17872]|uniref:MFS transporter n=1 Tax=Celerinatantimonas sp. MCCC 1A17872 TaxID=3177514 RepID=UPI0038C923D5
MTSIAPLLLILATLTTQLSSGINYVTIPIAMVHQGYGNTEIGVAMAFEILGVFLLYRPLSHYIAKCGLLSSYIVLTLVRIGSLLLLSHSRVYGLWILGIFSYGLANGMILVMTQTWLNILAQGKWKGLFMGLFSSALSCGVALGPIVLQLSIFQIGATFELNAALTLVPLLIIVGCPRAGNSGNQVGAVRFRFALRHAKVVLISAFIGGIGFFGLPSFLTLYGMDQGLTEPQAQLLLTMFMFGSVSLGMLLSTCASFVQRSTIALAGVFCSVVCAVYLSLAVDAQYWVALIFLFIWGGSMGGIYAIGLTTIGERFCPQDQMTANMSYSLMDSLGGMIGLLVIGRMFDVFGPEGMTFVFVVGGCSLLIIFVYALLSDEKTFE